MTIEPVNVQAKVEYLFPIPICHVPLPDDVVVQLEILTAKLLHAQDKEDHSGQLAGKIYDGQQIAVPREG